MLMGISSSNPLNGAVSKADSGSNTTSNSSKTGSEDQPPKFFTFLQVENGETSLNENSKTLSVVSYNVLADCYTDPNHFPNCDARSLDFTIRSSKIIGHLKELNADIICLQECDWYEKFYKKEIEELGYEVFYHKRPYNPDGCLIALKKQRGLVVKDTIIRDMDTKHCYTTKGEFIRGNIACLYRIMDEQNGNKVINLVNTHFFWNPQYDFVKYFQMYLVLQMLTDNVKENEPILFCGDLNSLPNSNAVHMVLTKQPPQDDRCEHKLTAPEKEYYNDIFEDFTKNRKPFNWAGAYSNYKSLLEEKGDGFPDFTNYTAKFKGTLDHIFYTKNSLKLLSLLRLPTQEEIKNKSLPNLRYPSDHLPIMAVFNYANTNKGQE